MERDKNAVIFHGTGEGPESYWIPYVRRGLEQRGFQVVAPQLPDDPDEPGNPGLDLWLPEVLQIDYAHTELLIAHSSAAPLALSVFERLKDVIITQAILVAGYCSAREQDQFWGNPMLQESYNWARIRANVGQVVCLNSDNDPYNSDITKGQEIVDLIGSDKGRLIVMKDQGHMGSNSFNQPYKEFPLLLQLVNVLQAKV